MFEFNLFLKIAGNKFPTMCVHQELSLPRRVRDGSLGFRGSNYSDHLGPIVVEPWHNTEKVWHLSRKEKKILFAKHTVLAGGSLSKGLADTSKWRTKDAGVVSKLVVND